MSRHPYDFQAGCPDNYQAAALLVAQGKWLVDSQAGTITSARTGKVLRRHDSDGYVYLNLPRTSPRAGHCVFAHRVLWELAVGPVPEGWQIDHINSVRDDNRSENLRLLTVGENKAQGGAHDGIDEWTKGRIKSRVAAGGNTMAISRALGLTYKTVRYWRHRWHDPAWLGWGRGVDAARRRHDQHFSEVTT